MRTTFTTLISLFALSIPSAEAQELINKNIYLIQLEQNDSAYQVTKASFLSSFNSSGTNDHPSFSSENKIYLSASLKKNGFNELDIFELNLTNNEKIQITETVENELHPKASPDAYYFTAIREEADVDRTKRLWKFPVFVKHEKDMGKPLFPYIGGIENYEWVNRSIAALVVEAENSHRLFLGKVSDNSTMFVASDVGTCIQKKNNSNNIYYLDKSFSNKWMIKEAILSGNNKEDIDIQSIDQIESLAGQNYFGVLPNNQLISAKGSKLCIYDPKNSEKSWSEIVDLSPLNITNIESIDVSNRLQLLLVTKD
ncbi:MAG: hypothetical protein P8P48_04445 [Saprospiraceae bacterium]|nr:hypothetical protein [Saprospiraceae bacterium]